MRYLAIIAVLVLIAAIVGRSLYWPWPKRKVEFPLPSFYMAKGEIEPASLLLLEMDPEAARAQLTTFSPNQKKRVFATLRLLADKLLWQGQEGVARKIGSFILRHDGPSLQNDLFQVQLNERTSGLATARTAYEKLLNRGGDKSAVYLAIVMTYSKDAVGLYEWYKKNKKSLPAKEEIYLTLAEALATNWQYHQALSVYKAGTRRNPKSLLLKHRLELLKRYVDIQSAKGEVQVAEETDDGDYDDTPPARPTSGTGHDVAVLAKKIQKSVPNNTPANKLLTTLGEPTRRSASRRKTRVKGKKIPYREKWTYLSPYGDSGYTVHLLKGKVVDVKPFVAKQVTRRWSHRKRKVQSSEEYDE